MDQLGVRPNPKNDADPDRPRRRLRGSGCAAAGPDVLDLRELEIPARPRASFDAPGGQRLAVYELVRPHTDEHFAGRIDT
jgi:hypothetical protein